MYANEITKKIAEGFGRCTREFANVYDWEFELDYQVRVAMCPESPGFTIGALLLCENVKNPMRKTLIAVSNQTERDVKKLFVDQYYDQIPERIRQSRYFKDRFILQKYGWLNPFDN